MIPAECPWICQVPDLPPSGDDVHVWRAELDHPSARMLHLMQTLSDDERARAARFHFERDRRRFVVRRAAVRVILGRYLGIKPDEVRFDYGPHGRPHLAEDLGGGALQFSLTHSHELALCAVAENRTVGIDLEHSRPLPNLARVAAEVLSASEYAIWRRLPPGQRQHAFYLCWTRKEAYLKAVGSGLSRSMKQLDVTLTPGKPARLLRAEGDAEGTRRWSVETLAPGPDYVAALVVEGHGWQLTCWNYEW